MTTTPGDGDEANESTYTDMQIHDSELPEDLQPENDLGSGGDGPSGDDSGDASGGGPDDPSNPGIDNQLGQVPEGTQTGSDSDAAAADAPASGPPAADTPSSGS